MQLIATLILSFNIVCYQYKFANIVMGGCEQAGSTQGNPVLEILPNIGKFS